MSRFTMWRPERDDDYRFFDETIREMFEVGGVAIYLHKYIGPTDTGGAGSPTEPNYDATGGSTESSIQDLLFLENRDRNYDPDIYELRAVYNVTDSEFNLSQFAEYLQTDTLNLEFHLNACLESFGRKLMNGDVLELPHLRDDALLDPSSPAINKFYVVQDVTRAADGWSPIWRPHIIRTKITPMPDSVEYSQILSQPDPNNPGSTLEDSISDYQTQLNINQAIVDAATADVPYRNFQTEQFYVVPGDQDRKQYPWIFAGDGIPPDGAALAGSGNMLPANPTEGEWFLHTGYQPNVLFQFLNGTWIRQEVDFRLTWTAAHRILNTFINDENTTTIQDETFPEKQIIRDILTGRGGIGN